MRRAAHMMHSRHDGREITQAARDKFFARFLVEVDPDGALPEDERIRRAAHARKAYYLELQLKSLKARRKRAERKKAS